MSLLNPALLYGLLLVVVPVLIHYLLKSKPKKLIFPALRLLVNKQRKHQRRMNLKHLLLLLLRMLVIGLLVMALVRPSLPSANYGLSMIEWFLLGGLILAAVGTYAAIHRQLTATGERSNVYEKREMRLRSSVLGGFIFLTLLLVGVPWGSRVWAEMKSPVQPDSLKLPVASVLVFDTSASMEYLFENHTRLGLGKNIAVDLLEDFPSGSRVAIADSMTTEPILFQNDLSAAFKKLNSENYLKASPLSVDLSQRVKSALKLQDENRDEVMNIGSEGQRGGNNPDRFVRDVYLFTDLASSAWNQETAATLKNELEARPWLSLYLIDVGVDQPLDQAIRKVDVGDRPAIVGRASVVTVDVTTTQPQAQVMVALYLKNSQGEMTKQGFESVTLNADQPTQIPFHIEPRQSGLLQGEFRLTGSDPLSIDDTRYFSIPANMKTRVLMLVDRAVDAFEISQALAPTSLANAGMSPYDVTVSTVDNFKATQLKDYSAVFLINVNRPSPALWQGLDEFVKQGGGLVTVLGTTEIDRSAYRTSSAEEVLPALPDVHSRFANPTFIDITGSGHPLALSLNQLGVGKVLPLLPIRRHWKVEQKAGSQVIAEYADEARSPALLEKSLRGGLSLLLTTAVDLQGGASYGRNWSDLARGGWAFLALSDFLVQRAAGLSESTRNFEVGQFVDVTVAGQPREPFLLRLPDLKQLRIELPYQGPMLTVRPKSAPTEETASATRNEKVANQPGATMLGQYLLIPSPQTGKSLTQPENKSQTDGFSVNLPERETDLTRLTAAELDLMLGSDQYQIARDVAELERRVLKTRLGEEIYPLLVTLMVIVFAGEHLIANYFYRVGPTDAS